MSDYTHLEDNTFRSFAKWTCPTLVMIDGFLHVVDVLDTSMTKYPIRLDGTRSDGSWVTNFDMEDMTVVSEEGMELLGFGSEASVEDEYVETQRIEDQTQLRDGDFAYFLYKGRPRQGEISSEFFCKALRPMLGPLFANITSDSTLEFLYATRKVEPLNLPTKHGAVISNLTLADGTSYSKAFLVNAADNMWVGLNDDGGYDTLYADKITVVDYTVEM